MKTPIQIGPVGPRLVFAHHNSGSAPIAHGRTALSHAGTVRKLLVAAFCSGIPLIPVRFGGADGLRLFRIIAFTAVILFLICERERLLKLLSGGTTLALTILFGFLTVGYILGHDVLLMRSFDRMLSVENLIALPVIFAASRIAAAGVYRKPVCFGLSLGVFVHVITLLLAKPDIVRHSYVRSSGLAGDPNIETLYVLPLALIVIGLTDGHKLRLLLGVILGVCVLSTIALTVSRAGLIAAGSATFILVGSTLRSAAASRHKAISAVRRSLIACLLLVAALYPVREAVRSAGDAFLKRFRAYSAGGGMLDDRTQRVEAIFRQNGFELVAPLGVGYANGLPPAAEGGYLPHNTFVDVLLIAGPVAALVFVGLYVVPLVALAKRAFPDLRREFASFSAATMLAALLSQAVLLSTLSVFPQKIHWLILGFIYGQVGPGMRRGNPDSLMRTTER